MATNHYAPGVLVPDITVLTEAQWLEKRRNGIGGSDAAKILGISPFVTRKECSCTVKKQATENNR